jgi:hypothetical protein
LNGTLRDYSDITIERRWRKRKRKRKRKGENKREVLYMYIEEEGCVSVEERVGVILVCLLIMQLHIMSLHHATLRDGKDSNASCE